jgi:hypothetical protein
LGKRKAIKIRNEMGRDETIQKLVKKARADYLDERINYFFKWELVMSTIQFAINLIYYHSTWLREKIYCNNLWINNL